jgi:hypothetical protein
MCGDNFQPIFGKVFTFIDKHPFSWPTNGGMLCHHLMWRILNSYHNFWRENYRSVIVLYENFIPTLCCWVALAPNHYIGHLSFIFRRYGGLSNCVPLVDTIMQTYFCGLILGKLMNITQHLKNPRSKATNISSHVAYRSKPWYYNWCD